MQPKYKSGEAIGQWRLVELLGAGGNGEVWRANAASRDVALKIVRRRPTSEAYQRFVREVEAAAAVSDVGGVLPVVETHLPETPTRADPAWIAMEIAVPVREALAEASVETVVEATRDFATTL